MQRSSLITLLLDRRSLHFLLLLLLGFAEVDILDDQYSGLQMNLCNKFAIK